MATTTRKGARKGKTTKSATSKVTRKSTAKKTTQDGPSKRELQRERDAQLRARVVELREAETSWGEIAEEIKTTPGKAQFLFMQHQVESTPRLRIKHSDEDSLVAGIRAARDAQDAHSSWGWIAARTGVSEGTIKKLAEEAGMSVKGSNVAVARAEANGGGVKKDGKTTKQAGRAKKTTTRSKGSAKTVAARKRANKRAKRTADPT